VSSGAALAISAAISSGWATSQRPQPPAADQPGGGGASESTEAPRYRTWFEGYGNYTKNGAAGDFVGDTRKTWGGVAGIGARVAPGINIDRRSTRAARRSTFRWRCNRPRST
jgi:hypothetical protein